MKNAVITGATKGIGLAIAELLASKDINLLICSRSETDLSKTQTDLLQINPDIQVHTCSADLGTREGIDDFASFVNEQAEEIHLLVNNAGIFLPGEITKEEEGQLERMMETNLYSAYYLTRALLPGIKRAESGHIFNMCSIASKIAYPNGGSYSISKFALLGFSKVLREELKEQGVKVTAILPGATWSNSWAGVELPESRLMQANDIAIAVWGAYQMSPSAVVEEIVIRPQLGDL